MMQIKMKEEIISTQNITSIMKKEEIEKEIIVRKEWINMFFTVIFASFLYEFFHLIISNKFEINIFSTILVFITKWFLIYFFAYKKRGNYYLIFISSLTLILFIIIGYWVWLANFPKSTDLVYNTCTTIFIIYFYLLFLIKSRKLIKVNKTRKNNLSLLKKIKH